LTTSRGRRSRICLKAYRLYLLEGEGALDDIGLSDDEIHKIKEFHAKLETGVGAYVIGRSMRIPEFVSKAMGKMHEDWLAGRKVRDLYNANEHRPRVARAYELLLAGLSFNKLLSIGFLESEIEGAQVFRKYEAADMLPVMIAQKTSLATSTIRKMQKAYRDSLNNVEVGVEMREELIA
jgi:hypothetical protein